jgi:hypothetical protein
MLMSFVTRKRSNLTTASQGLEDLVGPPRPGIWGVSRVDHRKLTLNWQIRNLLSVLSLSAIGGAEALPYHGGMLPFGLSFHRVVQQEDTEGKLSCTR